MESLPRVEPFTYQLPTGDGNTARVVRTFTQAQVTQMLRHALDVVDELEPPEDLRLSVFAAALQLTGQFVGLQSPVVVPKLNGGS